MKKFLALVTLVFSGLIFAQNVNAQGRDRWYHGHGHENRPRVERQIERRDERRYDRPRVVVRNYNDNYYGQTVNEYQDVLVNGYVYRYYYRVTIDRFGNEHRFFIRRERLDRYDYRNRNKFRFNVFLRF